MSSKESGVEAEKMKRWAGNERSKVEMIGRRGRGEGGSD